MHVDVKRLTLTSMLTKGELLPEDSAITFDDLSFTLSNEEIEKLYDKYFNSLSTEEDSLKELFDASWYDSLQEKGLLTYKTQEIPFNNYNFSVLSMDCQGDNSDRHTTLPNLFLKDASLKPIFKSATWAYFRLDYFNKAKIYYEITSRLHIDNAMGMEYFGFSKDRDDLLAFNLPMKYPMLSPVQKMLKFTSLNAQNLKINYVWNQKESETQTLKGPCSMLGCRMPGLPNLYKVPLMIDIESIRVGEFYKCVPMLYVALAVPRTTTDLFQSGLVYKKGTNIYPVEMLYSETCKENNIPSDGMFEDLKLRGQHTHMPTLQFTKGNPCVYGIDVGVRERYMHTPVVIAEKRLREGYNIDVTSALFAKMSLSMKAFRYLIPHVRKFYSSLDTLECQYLTDVLDYMQAMDALYSEHKESLKLYVEALCNPGAYNLPLLPIYVGDDKRLNIKEKLYCECFKGLKEPNNRFVADAIVRPLCCGD